MAWSAAEAAVTALLNAYSKDGRARLTLESWDARESAVGAAHDKCTCVLPWGAIPPVRHRECSRPGSQ